MTPEERNEILDRHALVMAVWVPAGFCAVGLIHHGLVSSNAWWLAGGFAAVLAGFVAHVIINAALGTPFTTRETGLGLALFMASVVALALALLLVDGFAATFLLPSIGGIVTLVAAVIFYMVTRYGTRNAFEQFDVIRDNNPRRSSRLPHRGGRK